MACLILNMPLPKVYRQLLSHGINLANTEEIRDNFRIITSVAFAHIYDSQKVDFGEKNNYLIDVLLSEQYAFKGYVTLSDNSIVMCSYAGFEKITSKWARETFPECRGVITTRIGKFNEKLESLDFHSVSIYI